MGKRVLAASACVTASLVLLLGGCLGSETSSCGDVLCPPETVCAKDFGSCFAADAVSGCKGQDNGSTCATATFEDGVCDRGVCFASSCGDGVINGDEVCDDGAREGGDGCSADCMSDETCGNGITDDLIGEECDCGDGSGAITAGCVGANSETAGATCRTSCIAHCGDDELNSSEQCEPDVLIAETCVDLGFDLGAIGCGQLCQLDFQSCINTGWQPTYSLDDSLGTADLIVVSANLAYAGDGRRVLKFDGTSWSTNYTTVDPVQRVWATSENDVWVSTVGCTNDSGLFQCTLKVFQDDGSGWQLRRSVSNETRGSLWGTGPNDLYLAGSMGVAHWDGSGWTTEVTTMVPDIFNAISGSAAGDVWVTGNGGVAFRKRDGIWDKTVGPNYGNHLQAIWFQGAEVWLGGVGRVFHWDGVTWVRTLLPNGSGKVRTLWSGNGGLFASTDLGVYQFGEENWLELDSQCSGRISGISEPWMACAGAVSIYQGHGWGRLPNQDAERSSARSRSEIWTTIIDGTLDIQGLYHFDGEAWTQTTVAAGTAEWVMATSDTVYVAGKNQWIAALNDTVETTIRSGFAAQPQALWANDEGLVVVPERQPPSMITNQDYRISWKDGDAGWETKSFVDRTIVWADAHGKDRAVIAIGNENNAGVIVRFTGTTWQIEEEVENQIQGVWVQDQDNAVVVGTAGFVLFYENGVWSEQVLPAAKNLIAVSGTSMSDLFAITEFNEIWHYDGVVWTEVRGLNAQRFDVQVTPDSILYLTESGVDAWIR